MVVEVYLRASLRAGNAARTPTDAMRTRPRAPAPALRTARERAIPCIESSARDLERAADSSHHEGACAIVRPRHGVSLEQLAAQLRTTHGAVLALDRVGNPHNIGAILRSAAYFGAVGIIVGDGAGNDSSRALTPAAVRTAEGGAEFVPVVFTTDLAAALGRLKSAGASIVCTDAHAPGSALGYAWPRPCVLVLGNERDGISAPVRALADALVAIPGTGDIDSLNVSVAAGVLLAELRRAGVGTARPAPPRGT